MRACLLRRDGAVAIDVVAVGTYEAGETNAAPAGALCKHTLCANARAAATHAQLKRERGVQLVQSAILAVAVHPARLWQRPWQRLWRRVWVLPRSAQRLAGGGGRQRAQHVRQINVASARLVVAAAAARQGTRRERTYGKGDMRVAAHTQWRGSRTRSSSA